MRVMIMGTNMKYAVKLYRRFICHWRACSSLKRSHIEGSAIVAGKIKFDKLRL